MKLQEVQLDTVLKYEQPTNYIVHSSNYTGESSDTPVLTAGKTFVLGYTKEKDGIFQSESPVIIFDDFTTASKLVDFPFKVKSSAMKILNVDTEIADAQYIYYLMQNIKFPVRKHKRHWISEYSKIKILLPSLQEQKRITNELGKVFAEIDKGVEFAERNNRLKDNLLISYPKSLFSSEENVGGVSATIGDVLLMANPGFACSKRFESSEALGTFHIRPNNIGYWGKCNLSKQVFIQKDKTEGAKVGLKKGEILFNNTNSKELVGRAVYVSENINAGFSNHITRLRVDESKIDPRWLVFKINELWADGYFLHLSKKWIGQAGVDIKMLKNVPIEYPSLSQQKIVINKLERVFEAAKELESVVSKQRKLLSQLRDSVINSTFQIENATESKPILSPIQVAIPQLSDLQQAIGLTLKRFPRGEMVVAKVLYLAQSIFKVPLGVSFTQQTFGPYSFDIKTAIDDGLSSQKGIFVKKGTKGMEVLSLSTVGTNVLNQLSGCVKKPMEDYLNVMMPLYFSSKSNSIELLATICKIIDDEKTSDDQVIYKKLQKWKPNKFGDSEIYRTISLIKKQKWDQKILQV